MRALAAAVLLLTASGCNDDEPTTSKPSASDRIAEVMGFTSDRATWEARAAQVRAGLLDGMQLHQLPARTPLDATSHSLRQIDGYTVENVVFQSLPGVYVTGNLYRPAGRNGPFPGLLQTHGHFAEDKYFARTLPDNQASAGHLAQMGAVVLAYDMVGYGDFKQLPHDMPFVMALQFWNSMRAVDYLLSLPDVDAQRIGAFGPSGGAIEVMLLAALDPRVVVAGLVVMISAGYDGSDLDEIGMPIRATGTNNTEISATLAPRPTLFVSDGSDWTKDFPTVDLPYLNSIYALYGQSGPMAVHLPNDKHGFGPHKRPPVYSFFVTHFGLEALPLDESAAIPEHIQPEPNSVTRVFDEAHPRPANAVTDPNQVKLLLYGQ
jgi:dienelactone hydrolase